MVKRMLMVKRMNKIGILYEAKIIKVDNLSFVGKDLVELNKWEDFCFMLGGSIVIYEFEERYYHITEQVAFCIKIKEGLKEWNLTMFLKKCLSICLQVMHLIGLLGTMLD